MSFYDNMKQTADNVSFTENGMEGYKTTYHPLLDMNYKITSYRRASKDTIIKDFKEIINSSDCKYALKFLFMVRDVREGLGERDLFRTCIYELIKSNIENINEIMENVITKWIPEFGRLDDIFVFINTSYEPTVINFIKEQLKADKLQMKAGKPISLLAKWMPSNNTSSKKTVKLANYLSTCLELSPKQYRKLLSSLRKYLKVTEVMTSANKWEDIDYNAVPSKANVKYNSAFLRHDEDRRRDFLAKLRLGVEGVKINSSVNYPHDIVTMYMTKGCRNCYGFSTEIENYDEGIEQLWKNLKQIDGLGDTIVVRDGSGSMETAVGSSGVTAIAVATGLSIYCSEHLHKDFKDKFITFSRKAKLVDLSKCSSLMNKLNVAFDECDYNNTNLESVFNLILKTAVDHHLSQEDIPSTVLIISDMEFDCGVDNPNAIKSAEIKFKNAGYKIPKLVFWNVCGRTGTIPITQNDLGVVLMSGFSVNTLKLVLSGSTDPFQALTDVLDGERYKEIPYISVKSNNPEPKAFNLDDSGLPDWLKE